jgi:hypothetical protein
MADFAELLPKMLFGEELKEKLTCLPEYSEEYRNLDAGKRLLKLTDIYKVFVPNEMAVEIYHKLYMMTSMSLGQKGNVTSVQQMNANHRWMHGGEFHGVVTGATSTTVIGNSGIGKTSCIQFAVDQLGDIIEIEKPRHKIIPVVIVSCPFDSNYRGLLCQILISIDECLGTNYYEKSQKSTMNAQQILGLVCQVCHLYLGTLIIDEIQFLVEHKAGKQLYRMILQLINASGINVMLVGTNECLDFFQQAPQMARRTAGLQYGPMDYGEQFKELCKTLFSYQYVKKKTELNEGLKVWLYEHSGGNSANLVSLIHDAQEIAILGGRESLSIETLTEAYSRRMQMLHTFIEPSVTKLPQAGSAKKNEPSGLPVTRVTEEIMPDKIQNHAEKTIADMVADAKAHDIPIVDVMRQYFSVTEVSL